MIKTALRYGGWLFIGGLMAQGFSYLGRLIMISAMDSFTYGRFVLLWNFYLFILIFGHFNLHSPLVYRIQGNLGTLYSNKTLAYAALQLTFITGTISSIAIVLYSMYLQYSVFIGLLLGFSLLMYSIFITLDGLSRSINQPNYGSLSYALIGLIRIFLISLIALGIIYSSSDYFVLAYIIPIYILPLPIFVLFWRKSGISIKNAFTKVYYKEIKWLIFSSFYVVISDLSKNGYLFFLVSFIAYTINIEALKVFDFIFTIISLSALVLSNVGLTFIFLGQKIENGNRFLRKLIIISFAILFPIGLIVSFLLNEFNVINIVMKLLNLSYSFSFINFITVDFVICTQLTAFSSSGYLQGNGLFKNNGVSYLISLLISVFLTTIVNFTNIAGNIFSIGIFFLLVFIINSFFIVQNSKSPKLVERKVTS